MENRQIKIELNGETIVLEASDKYYYFNGLKLEYDYGEHAKFIGLSLVGIDESKYNDTKCIILPKWITRIQSNAVPENLKENLEYLYGPGVKVIERKTFEDCTALKICATNNVEKIGLYAFKGCSNLMCTPYLGNVEDIGSYAFEKCSNLTGYFTEKDEIVNGEIVIPKSVNVLNGVFKDCTSVKRVVFEERDNTLGLRGTFLGCIKLSEIVGLFDGGKNDPLVRMGKSTFGNTGLTKIVIPHNIFVSCDNANSLWFSDCKGLKSIEIHVRRIPYGLCYFCKNLTDVKIGDEVKEIGDYAFENNSSLTSIDINNVTSIGKFAFEYSGLTNIEYKNKKIIIGENAFQGTPIQDNVKINEELNSER